MIIVKKILKILVVAICLILIVAIPAWAYTYSATITLTESSGNNYTNYPFKLPIDNGYLANQGYITSTGLDVNVNSSGVDVPTTVATDRTNFVTSLPPNSSLQPLMTFGNTPLASMPIVLGDDGYITVPYDVALEPGNDFNAEFKGYINTSAGSGQYLLNKSGAITIDAGTTTTGKITAIIDGSIKDSYGNANTNYPTYGVIWNGQTFTASSSYGIYQAKIYIAVVNGSPTNPILHLRNTVGDLPDGGDLTTANGVYDAGTGYITFTFTTPYSLTIGTKYAILVSCTGDAINNYAIGAQSAAPYAGGTLVSSADGGATWSFDANYDVKFITYDGCQIETSLVSSAVTLNVYADATDFKMDINGVNVASNPLYGISVLVNVNDIILDQNNVMPYMDYFKWTVGGIELVKYQPNDMILSGTIYNTGTATFTHNSTSVTGIGTVWGVNMIGGKIRSDTDGIYYDIAAVPNATTITLSGAYQQTGGAGHNYQIGYPTSYTAGTVTLTSGSPTVLGGGTTFTSSMVGGKIKGNTDGVYYSIIGFTDTTHITLSANYEQTGGAGLNYTLLYNTTGLLPNLDSAGLYPATITWGSNAVGIAATVGALTSSGNISVVSATETPQLDMAKQKVNMGDLTGNNNAQLQKNIFTPWFQPWSTVTNVPLIGFFLFWATAALIFCVVIVMKYTGSNQLIGGIVMIVGEILLFKLGIYELWFLIVTVFVCLSIIIFERKPSL